jgi:nucleotide-binding universal stress UspA family protein
LSVEIRCILIPLDFSHHVEAILDWGAHLAEEHKSRVLLLHAYHLPVEFQQLEGAYLPPDFWSNVKAEALQTLERHSETLRAKGIEVETVVREGYPATVILEEAEQRGYPATVILEEAEQRGADLIVIGTRGLSGLKHLLLGSIAERVVQKAHCPVLTVKTPS